MPNDDGFNGWDDGYSGDQEMHATGESFAEPPAKTSRRTRWITGAAAVAAAVGIGVAVVRFSGRASIGDDRTLDDLIAIVQGHFKQQAHGPDWSQHRKLWIDPYPRQASAA